MLVEYTTSRYIYPFRSTKSCKNNEFFNSASLDCQKCSRDPEQENYQRKAVDGLSCVCKNLHKLVKTEGSFISCKPCSANQVTSSDGWKCVSCSEANPFKNTSQSCSPCENNSIIDEKFTATEFEQYCKICESTTWPNEDGTRCIRCPFHFLNSSKTNCTCPSDKFVVSGGMCITKDKLLPNQASFYTVKFENGEQVKSDYFVNHFEAAVYNCKMLNITACNLLANLCVLMNYENERDSNACTEFIALSSSGILAGGHRSQRNLYTPWLYHSEDDAKTILYKTNVPNEFSSKSELPSSKLNFIVFKYSLNGSFLGSESYQIGDLQLCKNFNAKHQDIEFTFGTRYEQSCEIRIKMLWNNQPPVFYDMYLSSKSADDTPQMYTVPVLIKNLHKNGQKVNEGSDISKWQLVRRFYLVDSVSGIESHSSHSDSEDLAKVFRYAKDISLRIMVQQEDNKVGYIHPPLLIITYAEISSSAYAKNSKLPVTFSVIYSMDQAKSMQDISIALGVLSSLCVLWSAFQTWSWSKRAGKEAIDFLTLGKFVIFISGNLANVFFIVMFASALNWLIIFKKQDVIHLLLPLPEQENIFTIYLTIALTLKALQIVHLLVQQCTVNIFFIDWERPRFRSASVPGRSSSVFGAKGGGDGDSGGGSKLPGSNLMKTTSDKSSTELSGVSIWRSYFVANEWAELQSSRRLHLSLHLFAVLFFLKIIGFENISSASPVTELSSSKLHQNIPYSTTCRFAIGASIYLSLAFIQVICQKVFYERFVEDKLQQFVDLCSVSNVSVFIMSTNRFGFYVHGRSPHGKSDVNMKEMHELLRREEEDLCGQRGLLPNTEQQTFQMALPVGVHKQYERLLLPLTAYSQAADRMQGVGGHLSRVDIDKVVQVYHIVNKFLSGFIEHAFKDVDYLVKDRVLLENIFDVECYEITDKGFFYNDNGHSFDSVLLYGHEITLLIFDVLLFCVVDLAAQNFVLAAVLTFVIGKIIQAIRHSAGRRNLVRKALIDERFLN